MACGWHRAAQHRCLLVSARTVTLECPSGHTHKLITAHPRTDLPYLYPESLINSPRERRNLRQQARVLPLELVLQLHAQACLQRSSWQVSAVLSSTVSPMIDCVCLCRLRHACTRGASDACNACVPRINLCVRVSFSLCECMCVRVRVYVHVRVCVRTHAHARTRTRVCLCV